MNDRYSQSVRDAVVTGYYARAVTVSDLARSRAQSGFTISSFLATGLVGAGVLSSLGTVPLLTRILGATALAGWAAAALLFARAVAERVPLQHSETKGSADDFIDAVLTNAADERDAIDKRRSLAQKVAILAALLTTLTVVSGLFLRSTDSTVQATIILTPTGRSAVQQLCPSLGPKVEGAAKKSSIKSAMIEIRPNSEPCRSRTLHIPREQAAAILG
jgi:hypothetical protein